MDNEVGSTVPTQTFDHITVLEEETIAMLEAKSGACLVDCTAGGGGHTARLLELAGPSGRVIAIDQDADAITHLETRFAAECAQGRLSIAKARFSELARITAELAPDGVDGIIADLGVSSPQLDRAERGFSFQSDGPLDMRMDPDSGLPSAAEVLATYEETDIADLIYKFGEERQSRRIARAIVARRQDQPIERTRDLAALVASATSYPGRSKKHPATKTFQALRIAVNQELREVEILLSAATEALRPGGRIGIISFHSLEDRIIKSFMKEKSGRAPRPRAGVLAPVAVEEEATFKIIRPFPCAPSEEEIARNPRARSAKLRVAERCS